jgi:hypothetical protein
MFKMRTLAIKNKELEASEMKVSEIVHEYINRLYFDLIKFPSKTFNNLKFVFKNVVKNGLKSLYTIRDLANNSLNHTNSNFK